MENNDELKQLKRRLKELEKEMFLIGRKPKYKPGDRVLLVEYYSIMGASSPVSIDGIVVDHEIGTDENEEYVYYYDVLSWNPKKNLLAFVCRKEESSLFASTEELLEKYKGIDRYYQVINKLKNYLSWTGKE